MVIRELLYRIYKKSPMYWLIIIVFYPVACYAVYLDMKDDISLPWIIGACITGLIFSAPVMYLRNMLWRWENSTFERFFGKRPE